MRRWRGCAGRHLPIGIALAAIVSIPLAFTAVTRGDWLLDFGGEDNWIYVKYFFVWANPGIEFRRAMDLSYKATRVPWILPGYLAYQLLGPLPATYVLHLTVLIGGSICCWAGLRRLFGDGAALATTLLLLAYPGFHGSGITLFWNYHGQAILAFYFVAMLGAVIGATTSRPLVGYMLAGAGLATCISTGLTYIVLVPSFAVFAVMIDERLDARRLTLMLVGGLLGAGVALVLFGAINVLVGGPFVFFWRQITYTLEVTDPGNVRPPFAVRFLPWFEDAFWLGPPLLIAIVSSVAALALVGRHRTDSRKRLMLGCLLQVVVAWAALIAAEVRGQPLAEIAYHFHMMLGPTAYALGALIWWTLRLDPRPLPVVGVVALTAGLVAPQVVLAPELRASLRHALDLSRILPLPPSGFWGATLLLILSGSLLFGAFRVRRSVAIAIASGAAGIAYATTAITPQAYLPSDRCDSRASQYRVIQRVVGWSADEHIDTRALIWYDPTETRARAGDCPPITMFPIYNAIQHGTAIPLSETPPPPDIANSQKGIVATAARNRWRIVLLTTPEMADQANETFQDWLAQAPIRGVARPRERFEAVDGDVGAVLQVFDIRPP